MKHIFRHLAAALLGSLVLASCDTKFVEQPLADAVSATVSQVILPGTGTTSQSVDIISDGEWIIIGGADWFTVDPTHGSGNATVYITPSQDNVDSFGELNGPRSEKLYVFGKEASAQITVTQDGESGLDASRTYSKVASEADVESGKGYLLVVNDGSSLQAAKAFAATNESYYSYIYTDKVEESASGVITRANASNGYVLEAKDGGYAIKMPNGRYLFQQASYNNFYSTEDYAKADVWNLVFNADGTVNITNVTVPGKYFQYSIGYSSFGAYGAAQDNAALPYLYKDSAAPSDEILNVAAVTEVAAKATTVTIPVSSNRTWKVRNHDSWINSFTREGSGNGAITVNFDANTQETPRTATFTIIGETTSFTVTLTQAKFSLVSIFNIADANAALYNGETQFGAELTDAVVTYVNGNNAFIQDATGGILLYKSGHGLVAGQKISGTVAMTGSVRNGAAQITDLDTAEASISTGAAIPVTTLTLAELLADYEKYMNMRVKIAGVTVTDALTLSDRNGKISQDGSEIAIYAQVKNSIEMAEGATGDLICYPTKYNANKQLGVWSSSDLKTAESISDIASLNALVLAGETEITAKLSGAVVTYVNGKNAFIEDATGAIQLYQNGHGFVAGQKISGVVKVKATIYQNYAEATSLDLSEAEVSDGAEIPATTLTVEALIADYHKYVNMRVKIEDITVTGGIAGTDRDGICTQNGSEIALRAQVANTIEMAVGATGDLICFPTLYKGNYQLGVWANDHFTVK